MKVWKSHEEKYWLETSHVHQHGHPFTSLVWCMRGMLGASRLELDNTSQPCPLIFLYGRNVLTPTQVVSPNTSSLCWRPWFPMFVIYLNPNQFLYMYHLVRLKVYECRLRKLTKNFGNSPDIGALYETLIGYKNEISMKDQMWRKEP